jgi:hypothetical protein
MSLACPKCGAVADLDGYDILGADLFCVFCNTCNQQSRVDDLLEVPEPEEWTFEHVLFGPEQKETPNPRYEVPQ